jgi:AcrR family transcriptional regulator
MTAAAADTEKRIVDAAAELFGERGYANTTTRAIAERAGVNEVTLFRKFGSKRGILEALGKSWTEHMAGFAVSALPEPEDTRGTLTALARIEVAQSIAAGPVAMRLVLDARFVDEIAEIMGSGPTDNFAGLAEYLGQRQAAGDLRPHLSSDHVAPGPDRRIRASLQRALRHRLRATSRDLPGRHGAAAMRLRSRRSPSARLDRKERP